MKQPFTGVLLACLVVSVCTQAGEFGRFDEVDAIVAQDLSRFAALWEQAKTETVRIALLGDSQETAPGGGGAVYMPRLNRSQGVIRSGKTDPLDFSGRPYMQVELNGTDDHKVTDLLAVRFVNESRPEGVVITDLAAGGYKASDIIGNHGNSAPMFAALGFDAAIIHLGANDTNICDAATFKVHLEEVISMLRKAVADPDYRIILMSDPDKTSGVESPAKRAQCDMYPGVHEAIALSDPNVLAINSRRLAHDRGWAVGDPRSTTYVADGVHYTELGGRVLAALEAEALLSIGTELQPDVTTPVTGTRARDTVTEVPHRPLRP